MEMEPEGSDQVTTRCLDLRLWGAEREFDGIPGMESCAPPDLWPFVGCTRHSLRGLPGRWNNLQV
jgi:hypothetical protein